MELALKILGWILSTLVGFGLVGALKECILGLRYDRDPADISFLLLIAICTIGTWWFVVASFKDMIIL